MPSFPPIATVTRFAPSPTGWLHLGHAYSAWFAWERARREGGKFLLRFEDIDHTRVREEFYAGIEEDLRWLGFHWDGEPRRQLDRMDSYAGALRSLGDLGVLYPCFCTRKDLAATAPQQGDGAVIYPGTCRDLPAGERERLLASKQPAWRMDMAKAAGLTGPLVFEEEGTGIIPVVPGILGDVVLARKDLATSYHLAVVVDDADQGVTLVTRGRDLLESTHVHRLLQALLNLPAPRYEHHALVLDGEGKRLAKRHDSLALRTMRDAGIAPEEIRELCARSLG